MPAAHRVITSMTTHPCPEAPWQILEHAPAVVGIVPLVAGQTGRPEWRVAGEAPDERNDRSVARRWSKGRDRPFEVTTSLGGEGDAHMAALLSLSVCEHW